MITDQQIKSNGQHQHLLGKPNKILQFIDVAPPLGRNSSRIRQKDNKKKTCGSERVAETHLEIKVAQSKAVSININRSIIAKMLYYIWNYFVTEL